MMGIHYLSLLAEHLHMPLVLCISLGSNSGSHEGTTPLGYTLQDSSQSIGTVNVIAGGNETGLSHHYFGTLPSGQNSEDVEIRVAENERGFVAEFWSDITDLYTVGFISPSGETISRIPMTLGRETRLTFLLESTVITVSYIPTESGSGRQLIFFRFENPTAGVWRIRVFNSLYLNGRYHIWLPVESFCKPETIFLRPNPDTTITNPGNARFPITISAYNHVDGSIYIHSSRGFTINERIKPDLAAPGVDVYGPTVSPVPDNNSDMPMTRKSGSSVSAAHAAGAIANLVSWGLIAGNDMTMSDASIRGYLVRGAGRTPGYEYPNKEFGYGTLNLYQSFLICGNNRSLSPHLYPWPSPFLQVGPRNYHLANRIILGNLKHNIQHKLLNNGPKRPCTGLLGQCLFSNPVQGIIFKFQLYLIIGQQLFILFQDGIFRLL